MPAEAASKISKVESKAADVSTAAATPNGKKTKKAKGGKESETTMPSVDIAMVTSNSASDTLFELVNYALSSILKRRDGFSSVILTDVVSSVVSPQAAAQLLGLFSIRLSGICSITSKSSLMHNNDVFASDSAAVTSIHAQSQSLLQQIDWRLVSNDVQVRKIVSWMECLLDSHFSAIALNANHHAPTRVGLRAAMEIVPTAQLDDAIDDLETVLGLWTHIFRTNRTKFGKYSSASNVSNSTKTLSVYTVDKLLL